MEFTYKYAIYLNWCNLPVNMEFTCNSRIYLYLWNLPVIMEFENYNIWLQFSMTKPKCCRETSMVIFL